MEERTRAQDLRLAVILELENLLKEQVESGHLQLQQGMSEQLDKQFWNASTRSGEKADQAYQELVRLMQRCGAITEDKLAELVNSVDAAMTREELLTRS